MDNLYIWTYFRLMCAIPSSCYLNSHCRNFILLWRSWIVCYIVQFINGYLCDAAGSILPVGSFFVSVFRSNITQPTSATESTMSTGVNIPFDCQTGHPWSFSVQMRTYWASNHMYRIELNQQRPFHMHCDEIPWMEMRNKLECVSQCGPDLLPWTQY